MKTQSGLYINYRWRRSQIYTHTDAWSRACACVCVCVCVCVCGNPTDRMQTRSRCSATQTRRHANRRQARAGEDTFTEIGNDLVDDFISTIWVALLYCIWGLRHQFYMYICLIYIYINVYMCIQTYCKCALFNIYVGTVLLLTCARACLCIKINPRVCLFTSKENHVYIPFTMTPTHTHTHARARAHTHTHTHTHPSGM